MQQLGVSVYAVVHECCHGCEDLCICRGGCFDGGVLWSKVVFSLAVQRVVFSVVF